MPEVTVSGIIIIIMNVAIYARVSTEGQETENQLHELREFSVRNNWTIVNEYIDIASGKSCDRPQFKQMFEDASRRKFDLVLFWALDRFTREGVLVTLSYLQRLTAANVQWKSYSEQFLDSCGPFRDVVISLMATLGKIEREKISERTKAGLQRARREGKALGRRRVPVNLVIVDRLQNEGLSLKAIADREGVSLSNIMRAKRAYKNS